MSKKIRKLPAILCVIFAALSFTGCADTTWAVKYNSITIPSGVYITYLINAKGNLESQAESSSSSSSSSSSAGLGGTSISGSSSSSTSSATDIWSQKIDGTNALTWAVSQATLNCKKLAYIEQQCTEKKLTLTSTEKTTANSYADQYFSTYTVLNSNGVSSSSLEKIVQSSYLGDKLFTYYYGTGGSKAIPDSQAKDYYVKNYVHIKQIFFNKYDSSSNLLSDDKLAKLKTKANQVLALAEKDKAGFDALVKKYNEDPGMTETPDGYIFNKSSSYIQNFKDTAFSMKVGDIKLIETTEGYHIMYKINVDPNASTYSQNKSGVLHAMKDTEFNTMVENALKNEKFQVNSQTINRYNPKNLKDS